MLKVPAVPHEVVINPKEAVMFTPILKHVMPDALEYVEAADDAYRDNPLPYLEELQDSVFTIKSNNADVKCSILPSDRSSNEMLVVYAPFSDSEPKSSAQDIYAYMSEGAEDPKKHEAISKDAAAPNSWSQMLKSATMRDMLEAAGRGMPVLTIFSPLPSGAFTWSERQAIKQGDFTPAAELLKPAVKEASNRLGNPHIDHLHFQGMSLGASHAAGAAVGTKREEMYLTCSADLQELIIGPKNYVPDLAKRFTIASTVGDKSLLVVKPGTERIPEPLTRRLSDRDGYEKAAIGRMLLGMTKRSQLKGLTNPAHSKMPGLIEYLAEHNVPTLVPLAEHSALTHQTASYFPANGIDVVRVRAEKDHQATHEIDEHVTLLALLAVANVARTAKG